MNNVNCDKCKLDFEMELNTKTIERDIQLTFFICPHCNHEYKSYYTNAKIRTRQDSINELHTKARATFNFKKQRQIVNRIDELVELNKKEMNSLRGKYAALT